MAGETGSDTLVLVCKPDYEAALIEEVTLRASGPGLPARPAGPGVVIVGSFHAAGGGDRPFVFERQRIENAVLFPSASHKQTARDIFKRVFPPILDSGAPWTAHVYAADAGEETSLSPRARSLGKVLLEFCRERFTVASRRYREPGAGREEPAQWVLNLCMTEAGVWAGAMPADRLSDSRPGGIHRMAFDDDAPSRSYLKIEEALDVMGWTPKPGERVVDLGAAPGGWTHAFLKRGCHVTAVDNGPLTLRDPERGGGRLVHLRRDGVTYTPTPGPVPVDWLVSDMLVATGKNIGLLRAWLGHRWARRMVVNIKLPQEHPYPALVPLETYLAGVPGLTFHLRQLYHDRREVTLMAVTNPTSLAQGPHALRR